MNVDDLTKNTVHLDRYPPANAMEREYIMKADSEEELRAWLKSCLHARGLYAKGVEFREAVMICDPLLDDEIAGLVRAQRARWFKLTGPWTLFTPDTYGLYWASAWHPVEKRWCRPMLVQVYPGKNVREDRTMYSVVPIGDNDYDLAFQEGCDYYADHPEGEALCWAPCNAPEVSR